MISDLGSCGRGSFSLFSACSTPPATRGQTRRPRLGSLPCPRVAVFYTKTTATGVFNHPSTRRSLTVIGSILSVVPPPQPSYGVCRFAVIAEAGDPPGPFSCDDCKATKARCCVPPYFHTKGEPFQYFFVQSIFKIRIIPIFLLYTFDSDFLIIARHRISFSRRRMPTIRAFLTSGTHATPSSLPAPTFVVFYRACMLLFFF